jgi:YggT family protein
VALFLVLLYYVLWIFFVLMIARLVLDVIQSFSPQWRPRGAVLVLAEVVYTPTDPPLKALRSVLPPLSIGQIRLDLAFLVIMLVTVVAMNVVGNAAQAAA